MNNPRAQLEAIVELSSRPSATEADALALVRSILEESGDITTDVQHRMAMFLPVGADFDRKVTQARIAHFRRLGRDVPAQPGSRDLE